jgi:hypothetical protein
MEKKRQGEIHEDAEKGGLKLQSAAPAAPAPAEMVWLDIGFGGGEAYSILDILLWEGRCRSSRQSPVQLRLLDCPTHDRRTDRGCRGRQAGRNIREFSATHTDPGGTSSDHDLGGGRRGHRGYEARPPTGVSVERAEIDFPPSHPRCSPNSLVSLSPLCPSARRLPRSECARGLLLSDGRRKLDGGPGAATDSGIDESLQERLAAAGRFYMAQDRLLQARHRLPPPPPFSPSLALSSQSRRHSAPSCSSCALLPSALRPGSANPPLQVCSTLRAGAQRSRVSRGAMLFMAAAASRRR